MSNGTTQRRSVFGGLLIILIGVLFLLHNFVPGLGIGRLFARYWPLLLIFWGLAKLFDHFAAQRTGQTKPPILTGGEIALLVIVFVVGAGFVAMGHISPSDMAFPDLFEEKTTSTEELPPQPLKPGAKISVSTNYGSISVHTGETNDIRVIATKIISASSESEGKRRAEQIKVNLIPVAEGYEVRPDTVSGAEVDLEMNVPKQVSIAANSGKGDISAADLTGSVSATAQHGNVQVHDVTGDIDASLHRGDARITGIQGNVRLAGSGSELELADIKGDATIEGEFYGPIRVRNVAKAVRFVSSRTDLIVVQLPGRMEMDSGQLQLSDTPGGVTLITKNRDVNMENVAGRIHIENRHGDINVQLRQPPHEEISISDESGEITLTMPAGSNFEIVASSRSGEIQNDFQSPALKSNRDKENSQLEGKVGTLGPQIRLTTTYGTIHIRKAP